MSFNSPPLRYLNEDEAEEKFKSRNKTLNLSLIMKDLKPMTDDDTTYLNPVRNFGGKFHELDDLDSETSEGNFAHGFFIFFDFDFVLIYHYFSPGFLFMDILI